MERARFNIIKSKAGKTIVEVIFSNNKKVPLSSNLNHSDPLSLNGKEIEVEREKGQIIKIICEDKVLYDKSNKPTSVPSQRKSSPSQALAHNNADIYSKAPYNFIPLNEKVISAENPPDFDRYHTDRFNRFTGYIDLEIKALTPLYIRDALTMEEYRERGEMEKNDKTFINPDFFSPGGILRIPGSSLRGMIRTMVEIVSYGKFESFEKDRKFHFRSFADKSLDLREQYREKILGGDKDTGYYPKVNAGYLVKEGLDYYIIPAKKISGTQFFRVEEKDILKSNVISEKMKKFSHYSCKNSKHNVKSQTAGECPKCNKPLVQIYEPNEKYKIGFKPVKFKYEPPKKHTNHSVPLYYAKITDIWKVDDPSASQRALTGMLVLSNWMRGPRGKEGKHLHWVIGPEDNSRKLELAEGVLDNYRNDKWREKDTDLLEYFKNKNSEAKVPCFYVERNGKVISFGHTGLFRVAYEKSLKEFSTNELKKVESIDIAEAIFGNETNFAGRIFVEDAYLEGEPQKALLDTDIPKILSNPKPTTFQHYLEQDISKISIDDKDNIRGLKTYNSETNIRGYKLYWHRTPEGWEEIEISYDEKKFYELLGKYQINKKDFQPYILEEKNKKIRISLNNLPDNIRQIVFESIGIYETQHTKLTPVKEGTTFRGRIRFENLSNVELGALLFVLDLPENLAHKLGMGKPLGLGSVEIKPTLYISNREKRYKDLFSEWAGIEKSADNNKFKKAFEDYMHNNEKKQSLWEVSRLKELKQMLDIKSKPDNSKTTYMVVDEFRKRKVLPKPTDV
ncbi:TIGR03986 family CRISPR-associated RAMP protein [hot springs metagenome]|uniref:TIGR03986 family CRISPR-associated RAMP protein n=1 Tax=hot springs metagenome TaxID=433727 RepID=A0A5J4KYF5_9ZZZZ